MITFAVAWKTDGKIWIIVKEQDDNKIVATAGGMVEGDTKTETYFTYTKAEGWSWKTFDNQPDCDKFFAEQSIES